MEQKITRKQAEFCNQYMIDLNGTQAAIRAGYSVRTANEQAARLLAKVSVKTYLSTLQAKSREQSDISKQEVLDELAAILRSKITDYLSFNGKKIKFKSFKELSEPQIKAIESISKDRFGQIELKLHGKSWSIERICKILGFDGTTDLKISLEKMDESALDLIINKILNPNKL